MTKQVTFTLTCTMSERWVSQFLGMLHQMERLGKIGSSRDVTLYADGDGDFRPRFEWPAGLPEPAEPYLDKNGHAQFDAG